MYPSLHGPRILGIGNLPKLGVCLLLIFTMLPTNMIASAWTPKPYTNAIVLALGSDVAVSHATDQIRAFVPTATVITVNSLDQLRVVTRNALREIIYVGHGFPNGLEVGSSIVPWQDIQAIVQDSPSQAQLFAACFSMLAQVPGKLVFGFKSLVDVDEAAMWVTTAYYAIEKQLAKIPQVLGYFYNILLDKIVNPSRNLLAFLGSVSPSIIFCLGPRPLASVQPACGGGGGGTPPPPACYSIGYSYNGYCIASIQNIWHVHYNTLATATVFYTHPDVYQHYLIGYDTDYAVGGNNLAAAHLTKSSLGTYSLAAVVSTALAGAAIGAIIGTAIIPVLGTLVGALIGAIVAALITLIGYITETQIINTYVRDETGAGWEWLQNWYQQWYGVGTDIKVGGLGWFREGVTLGIPFVYPLWYGGQDLGLSGW